MHTNLRVCKSPYFLQYNYNKIHHHVSFTSLCIISTSINNNCKNYIQVHRMHSGSNIGIATSTVRIDGSISHNASSTFIEWLNIDSFSDNNGMANKCIQVYEYAQPHNFFLCNYNNIHHYVLFLHRNTTIMKVAYKCI